MVQMTILNPQSINLLCQTDKDVYTFKLNYSNITHSFNSL